MTKQRFTDDGIEEIENQSFTDNLTGKTYWIDNGLDEIVELLNELYEENKRLTDKLNQTALELVDVVISQGKAVEISEMSYREFLDYRAKNGKPMELQL